MDCSIASGRAEGPSPQRGGRWKAVARPGSARVDLVELPAAHHLPWSRSPLHRGGEVSWEAVERRFREAGVPLRLVELPWFRVDVERNRGGERILLSPARTSLYVMDADAGQEQLLLLVKDRGG